MSQSTQHLPRGTVTFLFTDIAGSTRLWSEHPATMPDAYARHDAILREAIAQQSGVIYKTIGDAFQVAFPTAPHALAATLAAQRALQAEPWPLPEPLRVRMALHTGAVDPEADGDYRSPVLNRLGRLLGAGHGGQVLLSAATAELARGGLSAGADLVDLGEHRLRDLQPQRVHQLAGAGLEADFPPIATLDARPNNLPVQLTPFIGRERELADAGALLDRPDVRLLTLTGPGGTGKTRLGLQLAADASDRYPDGVWFVPLAPVTDPALVLSTIAGVLNIHETGDQPLLESIRTALAGKSVLLVLDNFEQVTAAAPTVTDLLTAVLDLTVLVTCRGRLGVYGEHEFPVPPLGVPDPKRLPSVSTLTQYEAVRLFIARAEAVKPAFVITNANAPAVAEICARLDGLPLAIELAAARIKLLPPEAMLTRLRSRLSLLTGGGRNLPARQQTLRGAIAWSYDLLSAEEQALFRRLAVFAGGSTLEAIETVAAADGPGLDVFDGLERLVELGLLRQSEVEGEARFTMLETIREYGLEQLEEHGEAAEAHQRHAAFYLNLAETAAPALRGGAEQGAWIERLETEHDNLRAALGWTLTYDPESALRLTGALGRFWFIRGFLSEGHAWAERSLAAGSEAPSSSRARALHASAINLSSLVRGSSLARDRYEAALTMAREIGDGEATRVSLIGLGFMAMDDGDLDHAVAVMEEGLALSRDADDRFGTYALVNNLGVVAAQQGDLDRAMHLMEEGLAFIRGRDDQFAESLLLCNLGEVALAQGRWTEAMTYLRSGLDGAVAVRADGTIAVILTMSSQAAWQAEQPEAAARLFGAADALIATMGAFLDLILPEMREQAVATVREKLGEKAYVAAWEAGRALSREEAVAEALELTLEAPVDG